MTRGFGSTQVCKPASRVAPLVPLLVPEVPESVAPLLVPDVPESVAPLLVPLLVPDMPEPPAPLLVPLVPDVPELPEVPVAPDPLPDVPAEDPLVVCMTLELSVAPPHAGASPNVARRATSIESTARNRRMARPPRGRLCNRGAICAGGMRAGFVDGYETGGTRSL